MFTDVADYHLSKRAFWPFDVASDIDGWSERGVHQVWQEYVRLWTDAVSSKVPFTVMAHPDIPKKLGFKPKFDACSLWEQMVDAAAAHGVMIEVNTSGLYAPCAEAYPSPELLARFCAAGVPCTVGSDAHTPKNVARDIEAAHALMWQAGYRVVTVPTHDGDRRQIPLD
jgi:histidinol-phosphatase (PHP family)